MRCCVDKNCVRFATLAQHASKLVNELTFGLAQHTSKFIYELSFGVVALL